MAEVSAWTLFPLAALIGVLFGFLGVACWLVHIKAPVAKALLPEPHSDYLAPWSDREPGDIEGER